MVDHNSQEPGYKKVTRGVRASDLISSSSGKNNMSVSQNPLVGKKSPASVASQADKKTIMQKLYPNKKLTPNTNIAGMTSGAGAAPDGKAVHGKLKSAAVENNASAADFKQLVTKTVDEAQNGLKEAARQMGMDADKTCKDLVGGAGGGDLGTLGMALAETLIGGGTLATMGKGALNLFAIGSEVNKDKKHLSQQDQNRIALFEETLRNLQQGPTRVDSRETGGHGKGMFASAELEAAHAKADQPAWANIDAQEFDQLMSWGYDDKKHPEGQLLENNRHMLANEMSKFEDVQNHAAVSPSVRNLEIAGINEDASASPKPDSSAVALTGQDVSGTKSVASVPPFRVLNPEENAGGSNATYTCDASIKLYAQLHV